MSEDIQRRIREKISEIERKSADDNYIYRGEPEDHGEVSSNLWREYGRDGSDIEAVQATMLSSAKEHIGDIPEDYREDLASSLNMTQEESNKIIDFEILTEIQHYGGKTNLIDFTTDYFIALFFACDGHHDEPGRVILQKTEEIQNIIERPRNPRHRVIAQKSIFVRPPKGFIDKPHEDNMVIIPKNRKWWMLRYLQEHHGISKETIYNDVYGFIRRQDMHRGAYRQFYIGFVSQNRGDETTDSELKQKEYENSIERYAIAINLDPNHAAAYNNRGIVYGRRDNYERAIEDFEKAIELNPNFADAYSNRGAAYSNLGNPDSAIADCTHAIELNPNLVQAYNNRGAALQQQT